MSAPALASVSSARRLLDGVVDYAGLFPPAALTMSDAVAHYAEQLTGADAWMLGRFVLPAARLPEFSVARASHPRSTAAWKLSAVIGADLPADVLAIKTFNKTTASIGAVVDSIEAKADSSAKIDALAKAIPSGVDVFVELPIVANARPLLDRLARHRLFAKIRTGGITAEAFPTSRELGQFLASIVESGVVFKATAGLHHPLRGEYRLTYAPDAPRWTMYGYLNVLLATAALRAKWLQADVEALLVERDPSALAFGADGVRWRGRLLETSVLGDARLRHLRSFGSCSFREPVDEVLPIAFPL